MLEQVKTFIMTKVIPFVAKYLVRWSLKFAGSVITYLGWEQSKYEDLILGTLLFLFGVLWTIFVDKKKGEPK